MDLGTLLVYFKTSPTLGLLRSTNAPFIIDFLERQFKRAGRISIPHSELVAALISYQEELHDGHPESLTSAAEVYLSDWCSPEHRWLRRLIEAGHNEPVYQLTPHTEDAFAFLDRVLKTDAGFIGTESRLKLIIETLSDLVLGSSDDPQLRVARLREQERRIQKEIARIESEGRTSKYQPAQIRERFITAVSLLKQLQGDFRAVEESFREITAGVQQRQIEGAESRGGILEFALDAEDMLKKEDQGVSFYEFVRLILSPAQTERLEEIIQEVRRIPELKQQQDGLETVRGMIRLLQREAEKVMRTNQRLSMTLRRLLDAHVHAERRRVSELLREIRGLAASLADDPPRQEIWLDLELDLNIDSPFRRTFWSEPTRFETVDLADHQADQEERLAAFRRLAALHCLEWRLLRKRIRAILEQKAAPTLGDILEAYPPKVGVLEALGYLQIARDDHHIINTDARERVIIAPIRPGEPAVQLTIPLVTFTTKEKRK